MKHVVNIFGEGTLYGEEDLTGKTFLLCTACMSIWSEMLSWANAFPERVCETLDDADNIVIGSCQVTDLAVLNDLRYLEALREYAPSKNHYITGCLARRFDLPVMGANRLDALRCDYTHLENRSLVKWAPPFWDDKFGEGDRDRESWFLREMYPLRIGVGCGKRCAYCTIRDARGASYELDDYDKLAAEFVGHDNVLLICDSMSAEQVDCWHDIAMHSCKPVAFRNIEPQVVMRRFDKISELSQNGLLSNLHSAVQTNHVGALLDMHRPVEATIDFINRVGFLRENGTVVATNIIVDYKAFPDPVGLEKVFDIVSWNPYWNGAFDMVVAKEKASHYFPWWERENLVGAVNQ